MRRIPIRTTRCCIASAGASVSLPPLFKRNYRSCWRDGQNRRGRPTNSTAGWEQHRQSDDKRGDQPTSKRERDWCAGVLGDPGERQ
jgi:hypothetical protein